ncbi:hypothetical protein DBP15_14645 [Streptomyces sp. CS065A]|nr:hypothetical protein DBP15_14645 [Streptomyces sp. CS065A]
MASVVLLHAGMRTVGAKQPAVAPAAKFEVAHHTSPPRCDSNTTLPLMVFALDVGFCATRTPCASLLRLRTMHVFKLSPEVG